MRQVLILRKILLHKRIAKISVAIAINESDRIINNLRLYLSAHTPPNGDRKNVGIIPHKIEIVIIAPD